MYSNANSISPGGKCQYISSHYSNNILSGTCQSIFISVFASYTNLLLCSAVRGCRYVLHIASPFPAEAPQDDNEIINPSVNGTLSVLQACHKHRVKRVVYTSSMVAILGNDDLYQGALMKIDKIY